MHTADVGRVAAAFCFVLLVPSGASAETPGRICGRVSDRQSHQPLDLVEVSLPVKKLQTQSSTDGRFCFETVPAGKFLVEFRRPGYVPLRSEIEITRDRALELQAEMEVLPAPYQQKVDVVANLLDAGARNSPSDFTLARTEQRNLAGVMTQDTLRAVQALPGVTSNDDFESRFSLRGAPFERIGVYLDGVLVRLPFHRAASESGGSLSLLNGETLGEITLHPGAPPLAFADRSAGALVLETREGRRDRVAGNAMLSASGAAAVVEGPIGRARRALWLVGIRKSYLEYILKRTADDPGALFGFLDGFSRLSYEPSPALQLDLTMLAGSSGFAQDVPPGFLDPLTPASGRQRSALLIFGARYTPNARLLLTPRFAFARGNHRSRNTTGLALSEATSRDWTGSLSGTFQWTHSRTFDFGGSIRRITELGTSTDDIYGLPRRDAFHGAALHTTAFLQPSFEFASGALNFSAGVRLDHHSVHRATIVSPRLSATARLRPGTHLRLAWGQYTQHPELRDSFSQFGSTSLPPVRSAHFEATLDHNFNDSTTVHAGFFRRDDRDLLFTPLLEPRLAEGRILLPQPGALIASSLRASSQGFQFVLQRRSAKGLSGWASYAYARSQNRDLALNISFPSDYDQRHTLNLYASYPLRPSVSLSGRWLYGSGFPVSGFFRQEGADYYLAEARNVVRTGTYQRLDVRMNKTFVRPRWRATLFVEAVNVLNRRNLRVEEMDFPYATASAISPASARVRLRFQSMFPILPTAGVLFEF